MPSKSQSLKPARLLVEHVPLLLHSTTSGPILDLACGDGHNGAFLASKGLPVICCDLSEEALTRAMKLAGEHGVTIQTSKVDLEEEGVNPLKEDFFGGIIVFRYLHRPLIPCIRKALRNGGILIYETFTVSQVKFGKPRNPDFLLRPGELRDWFADWEIIHTFEGIETIPTRAVAHIVCRKPV